MDADETTYPTTTEHLTRPAQESDAAIFARTLARLTRSRDYWQTRALLAESELLQLRQAREVEGR